MMLQMKFGIDWAASLGDILVGKCERTDGHRLESHSKSSPRAFCSGELKIGEEIPRPIRHSQNAIVNYKQKFTIHNNNFFKCINIDSCIVRNSPHLKWVAQAASCKAFSPSTFPLPFAYSIPPFWSYLVHLFMITSVMVVYSSCLPWIPACL